MNVIVLKVNESGFLERFTYPKFILHKFMAFYSIEFSFVMVCFLKEVSRFFIELVTN